MAKSTPLAPSMEISSNGGIDSHFGRFFRPFSLLAVADAHKRRTGVLHNCFDIGKVHIDDAGLVIRSEIPSTACLKTSSQIWKAERKVVSLPTMLKRRSLGMTIIASTASLRFISPCSASLDRWAPSNPKGLVTTAIVRMPCSWLFWPRREELRWPCLLRPPETKTYRRLWSLLGLFLWFLQRLSCPFPDSFLRLNLWLCPLPMWIFLLAMLWCNFWASVSAVINSTFLTLERISVIDRVVAGVSDTDHFYPGESFYFRIDFCHSVLSLTFLIFTVKYFYGNKLLSHFLSLGIMLPPLLFVFSPRINNDYCWIRKRRVPKRRTNPGRSEFGLSLSSAP